MEEGGGHNCPPASPLPPALISYFDEISKGSSVNHPLPDTLEASISQDP